MDFGSKYVFKYSLSEEESVSDEDEEFSMIDVERRAPTTFAEG